MVVNTTLLQDFKGVKVYFEAPLVAVSVVAVGTVKKLGRKRFPLNRVRRVFFLFFSLIRVYVNRKDKLILELLSRVHRFEKLLANKVRLENFNLVEVVHVFISIDKVVSFRRLLIFCAPDRGEGCARSAEVEVVVLIDFQRGFTLTNNTVAVTLLLLVSARVLTGRFNFCT